MADISDMYKHREPVSIKTEDGKIIHNVQITSWTGKDIMGYEESTGEMVFGTLVE